MFNYDVKFISNDKPLPRCIIGDYMYISRGHWFPCFEKKTNKNENKLQVAFSVFENLIDLTFYILRHILQCVGDGEEIL